MTTEETSSSQPTKPGRSKSKNKTKASIPFLKLLDPNESQTEDSHFRLKYIAEGAANVLYDFEPIPSDDPVLSYHLPETGTGTVPISVKASKEVVKNRLLRIIKKTEGNKIEGVNFKFFQKNFANVFDHSNLVGMQPVRFPYELVDRLNDNLALLDSLEERPICRIGSRLDDMETHGILVEKMFSPNPDESFTFEFKPKWLAQSPDAPRTATRCRNCAQWASHNAGAAGDNANQKATKATPFCPLGLLSAEKHYVEKAVNYFMQIQSVPYSPADPRYEIVKHHLVQFFMRNGDGHKLLRTLADAQERLCPGPMIYDGARNYVKDRQLRKLMVLRDCSLFIKFYVTVDRFATIEAKLADFDMKSIHKRKKWRESETRLKNGGYYLGRDLENPFDHDCYIGAQLGPKLPYNW